MAVQFQNYYEILGVARTAAPGEIKSAFRKLAKIHHPDVARNKAAGATRFREIREAYEVLSDPANRRRFDELDTSWRHGDEVTPPSRTSRPPPRPAQRPEPPPQAAAPWAPRAAPRSTPTPGADEPSFESRRAPTQPAPEPAPTGFSDFFEAFFAHTPKDEEASLFRDSSPYSPDAQDPQAPRKSARWFYRTESGQSEGPFDFVELAALLQCGDITGASLTKSDGDKDDSWKPFRERHQFEWARDMPPEIIFRHLDGKAAGPVAHWTWANTRYFIGLLVALAIGGGLILVDLWDSNSPGSLGYLVVRIVFLFFGRHG